MPMFDNLLTDQPISKDILQGIRKAILQYDEGCITANEAVRFILARVGDSYEGYLVEAEEERIAVIVMRLLDNQRRG